MVPTPSPSQSPTFRPTTGEPTSTSVGIGTILSITEPPTFVSGYDDAEERPPPPPDDFGYGDFNPDYTPGPTPPIHSQNNYDTAPDFADWDDFFESKGLHDLEDVLDDYSVVISYAGSRFYGTIIEPDISLNDLFPPGYHAFWDNSFNVDRTFIISDTTFTNTPVGVDFFEMRRRVVNSAMNPNVQFSYGPYGALIPLMDYE